MDEVRNPLIVGIYEILEIIIIEIESIGSIGQLSNKWIAFPVAREND